MTTDRHRREESYERISFFHCNSRIKEPAAHTRAEKRSETGRREVARSSLSGRKSGGTGPDPCSSRLRTQAGRDGDRVSSTGRRKTKRISAASKGLRFTGSGVFSSSSRCELTALRKVEPAMTCSPSRASPRSPFDGQRGTAYADRSQRAIFCECAKKHNNAVLKILDHVVLSCLDPQLCPLLDALKNGKS